MKLSYLVIAVASLTAVSAFAFPSLNQNSPVQADPSCANFSGRWKGDCDLGEFGKAPEETRIEQIGCYMLIIDGAVYPIDGVKNEEHVFGSDAPLKKLQFSTEFKWDASRKGLEIRLSGSALPRTGEAVPVQLTGSSKLEGDKLTEEFVLHGKPGGCTYTRQQ